MALAQLPEVELALGLQADDEEENVIRPSLTQPRSCIEMPLSPIRIAGSVAQTES